MSQLGDVPLKISIILPNYNGEKYLEKSIESFLSQNYQHKELIIVDGKSKDSSHTIIFDYASKYDNIVWAKIEDINVTDGFNKGLAYCTGDYIGFFTSDALYYGDDILKQIAFNKKYLDFDVIYFDAYSHFVAERRVVLRNCGYEFTRDNFLLKGCFIPFENIFFKRNIYDKYQLNHHVNLCSDVDFYLRILEKNLLSMHIKKPSTVNIYDGNNLSAKHSNTQVEGWMELDVKFLFDYLEKDDIDLHKSLMKQNYLLTKDFVEKSELWFLKLIQANKKTGFYSEVVLIKRFIPYWINLCENSTRLGIWQYFKYTKSPLTTYYKIGIKQKIFFLIRCLKD